MDAMDPQRQRQRQLQRRQAGSRETRGPPLALAGVIAACTAALLAPSCDAITISPVPVPGAPPKEQRQMVGRARFLQGEEARLVRSAASAGSNLYSPAVVSGPGGHLERVRAPYDYFPKYNPSAAGSGDDDRLDRADNCLDERSGSGRSPGRRPPGGGGTSSWGRGWGQAGGGIWSGAAGAGTGSYPGGAGGSRPHAGSGGFSAGIWPSGGGGRFPHVGHGFHGGGGGWYNQGPSFAPSSSGGIYPSGGGGSYPSGGGQYPVPGSSFPGAAGGRPHGNHYPTGSVYPSGTSVGGYPGHPSGGGAYPSGGGTSSSSGWYPSSGGGYPSGGGVYPSGGGLYPSGSGGYPSTGGGYHHNTGGCSGRCHHGVATGGGNGPHIGGGTVGFYGRRKKSHWTK